jgi:hypothetical protein
VLWVAVSADVIQRAYEDTELNRTYASFMTLAFHFGYVPPRISVVNSRWQNSSRPSRSRPASAAGSSSRIARLLKSGTSDAVDATDKRSICPDLGTVHVPTPVDVYH